MVREEFEPVTTPLLDGKYVTCGYLKEMVYRCALEIGLTWP
jgi:hypothetical protein